CALIRSGAGVTAPRREGETERSDVEKKGRSLMTFGGLLDDGSGGGVARLVADIAYGNTADSMSHPRRFVSPSLHESMFASPGLSLALELEESWIRFVGARTMRTRVKRAVITLKVDLETIWNRSILARRRDTTATPLSRSKNWKRKGSVRILISLAHFPNQNCLLWYPISSLFKECPHPDDKQRMELSKRLCLEARQVKFWFQNRRTQMKVFVLPQFISSLKIRFLLVLSSLFDMLANRGNQTHLERHENTILRQENDKLRAENLSIREAMRNPKCCNCGSPAVLGEISLEEQHLRIENARLKDELDRVCALAGKFLGKPASALASPLALPMPPNSSLELAVGTNGFAGLGSVATSTLPPFTDFTSAASSPVGTVVTPVQVVRAGATGAVDKAQERFVFLELALAAMDELVKMAQMEEPLWVPGLEAGSDALNYDEYYRCFSGCIGGRPTGFVSEATRETAVIIINSSALVDTLMDAVISLVYSVTGYEQRAHSLWIHI
ncbi:hypothetical protein BHM03_00059328, partial [Ensete ventricosum]